MRQSIELMVPERDVQWLRRRLNWRTVCLAVSVAVNTWLFTANQQLGEEAGALRHNGLILTSELERWEQGDGCNRDYPTKPLE